MAMHAHGHLRQVLSSPPVPPPATAKTLENSTPIEFDGLFDGPSTTNLTRLLEKAATSLS